MPLPPAGGTPLPVGGRLSNFCSRWECLTLTNWHRQVLFQGLTLRFSHPPPLCCAPMPIKLPVEPTKRLVLLQEIESLLKKRALEQVSGRSPGFYSHLFTVPKRSGGFRPVIDLKALNRFIICPHFHMETDRSIRSQLRAGEWTTSVDLSDAYLHIPVHQNFRKFLRLRLNNQFYQFRAMCFGLNIAPRVFTKLLDPVVMFLRTRGIMVHRYLDDWLIRASNPELVISHTRIALQLFHHLGLLVNMEKSDLSPKRQFTFLGMSIDLERSWIRPTEAQLARIADQIALLQNAHSAKVRQLLSLIGSLNHVSQFILLGRLHVRPLQFFCEGQSVQSENTDRPLGSVGHTFSFSSPLVVRSGQAVCRSALTSSGTGDVSPDRCEPGRLGSIPRRASSNGQVVPTGSPTPHIIVGAESSLQGSSSSVIPDLRQVSSPDVRQCHSSGIHQERRRNSLHCFVSGDSGNTALVCKPSCCTETILPSGSSQLHSRPVVSFQSGAGNRMDVALGSVQETPHPISTVGSGSLRNEIEQSAASVCESLPRPDSMGSRRSVTGVGRHEPICIPPLQTHPRSPSEASEISNTDAIDSTGLAEPVLVPRAAGTPPRPTSPNSSLEQTPASTPGEQVPPQSPDAAPSRLATIRSRLRQEGFSGTVAQYAAAPQRRSSLRLYQSHWRAFSTWCTERDLDPCEATVQQIADFLVFLHEVKKFAPSTIANYRSSIASTLGTRDGVPLSFHPCLSQLLKAFATSRPPSRPRVPEWDLSRVLRALRSADFEPPRWETRQDRMRCTWKTVFLLALATTSRRSELQALSRSPRDLVFADAGMSMRVVPGFLAKTAIPGMDPSPIFVPSLTPFSGRDNEDRLLCPVRMVQKYLAFTGGLIPKERLFRKVRGEGNPSSQTIASWIKACVRFTHQHRPDVPVSAHQVRRMSASWAFHGGSHSVDEILEAGTWATHSTFTSFYLADVRLQPDRRFRMQPIVARKQLTRF